MQVDSIGFSQRVILMSNARDSLNKVNGSLRVHGKGWGGGMLVYLSADILIGCVHC